MGSQGTKSEQTRDQLLDAAEELFGEHGFDGVSVREIGTSAGVNSALINYYFGGKSGLYEAVIERRMAAGRQVFESAAALLGSTESVPLTREVLLVTVRNMLGTFLRHMCSRPAFAKLMTREVSEGFPVARRVILRLMPLEPVRQLFERAQREGIIRDDIPAPMITFTIFGIHQHLVASAPVFREVAGVDPMDPETMEQLMESNLSLIFEGVWARTEREE